MPLGQAFLTIDSVTSCVYIAAFLACRITAFLDHAPRFVAEADKVVAFWDGKSRGTLNSVVQMLEIGKLAQVFDEPGDPVTLDNVLHAAERLGVLASMEKAKHHTAE